MRGLRAMLTTALPSVSQLSRKCGIPDNSQPYGPPWLVRWIALILYATDHNTGLENRDYCLRGPAALSMRHPSIRKSWH
jgi:hypothetical protein